jgi:hypothetical protein
MLQAPSPCHQMALPSRCRSDAMLNQTVNVRVSVSAKSCMHIYACAQQVKEAFGLRLGGGPRWAWWQTELSVGVSAERAATPSCSRRACAESTVKQHVLTAEGCVAPHCNALPVICFQRSYGSITSRWQAGTVNAASTSELTSSTKHCATAGSR